MSKSFKYGISTVIILIAVVIGILVFGISYLNKK